MDALFIPLAGAIGASVDQIKLIVCLLIAYPLGSIYIRIPSSQPAFKHLFNIGIALFYLLPVLHLYTGFLQLLGSVLGTFFIAKHVKGHAMPWIVFVFAMGHLTINHVIRAIYELSYETIEITGPQMVLTMKLTTFAWNVWDGRRDVQELDKWQLEKRVKKFPSLLEFLGYSFYFPGVLVGPYLEYAAYISLVDETLFKSVDSDEKRLKPGRAIPTGRKRVAYRKLVSGLVFLGLFVVLSPYFNLGVTLEKWFTSKPLIYRIGYYQICGFFERSKYYALWTLTEGASILTGLGFTGYTSTGASLWEGASNVDIMNIEFAPSFKVLLDSWNMKTNVWLRECVYKRLTPKGKKGGFRESMLTFATSAFWHGIAAGYYMTFFFGGLITTAGRLARSSIRPLVLPANGAPSLYKSIYDILGTLTTILLVNYAVAPFMLLRVTPSLQSWRNLNWYGHWIIGVGLLFFYAGGSGFLKRLQKGKPGGSEKTNGSANNISSNGTAPVAAENGAYRPPQK